MTSKTLDLIAGIVSLLGAVFIFSVSRGFPQRAALMPALISAIMAFASVALIFKACKQPGRGPSAFSKMSWSTLVTTIAGWICLIVLSKWINFFILAAIFLFSIAFLLDGKPKTAGGIIRFAVFSVGISIALWLLFSMILNVGFPVEGIFLN
ncbi:MAG: tripartite tricarboxylate transporter TctB family protein [Desulfobacteraceae bacterium]|jgi:hypothetical protein